jgi:hypothetical protein
LNWIHIISSKNWKQCMFSILHPPKKIKLQTSKICCCNINFYLIAPNSNMSIWYQGRQLEVQLSSPFITYCNLQVQEGWTCEASCLCFYIWMIKNSHKRFSPLKNLSLFIVELCIKWTVKVEVGELIARAIPKSNINFIFSFGSWIFVEKTLKSFLQYLHVILFGHHLWWLWLGWPMSSEVSGAM